MALLSVENLTVEFHTPDGIVRAVEDLSFTINRGKTMCVVGESGCGKSVTALSIMRLLPIPPAKVVSGRILLDNRDLLTFPNERIRRIRGNDIAMIFQDPMTSLNPVFTCGHQIMEPLLLHQGLNKKAAREQAIELLRHVRIPDPHKRVDEYPHQLSGGMRQRVMIAVALACNPKLLIADEPTTALDVTIQAQILDLLAMLKDEHDMSVMFITHDLGIVAEIADEVLVLYAGKTVERGSAEAIYENAKHPYTIGLLESVPRMDRACEKLSVIPGTLPDPTNFKPGCRFYDRCSRHSDQCLTQPPEIRMGDSHFAACYHTEESANAAAS
ncbi:MAG: ATP-binding cassette domain-containing protein [Chitinivibrionales bacterium]|nr:ATP-binding cassette domain-containing protein [Chitinivibrionales bacterium]MBD3357790.1 ATP-binding cassette domain-containing protein [Chitinivibrionales bacterium]